MAFVDECGTEIKCYKKFQKKVRGTCSSTRTECIRSVDHEVKDSKTASIHDCHFPIHKTDRVHFLVKKSSEGHLRTKGLHHPDSGDNLFGKRATLGYLLERLPAFS